MFYKNSVFELIEKCYFDDVEKKGRLSMFIEKNFLNKFYVSYEFSRHNDHILNIRLPNYLNYFKCEFSNYNVISLYVQILDSALSSKQIDVIEYDFLHQKIINIINGSYEDLYDSEIKIYAILALLNAFNRMLPKVALDKYYFILLKSSIFKTAFKKYDELFKNEDLLREKEKQEEVYFSKAMLLPEFSFIAASQGPYDPDLNDLLKDLEQATFIKMVYKKNSDNSIITDRGREHLAEGSKKEVYVMDLIKDSIELSNRFREWSGRQIEQFLKTHVIKDFSNYKKGEVLRY